MNLKNLLMTAALLGASASISAATFALWPAAGEAETQIPNDFQSWWNLTLTETQVDGVDVLKATPTDPNSSAASCGWMTAGATGFDFTQLADKDLVFDAMIEGAGSWLVRLTTPDTDAPISIAADGQFHAVRFNVASDFAAAVSGWANGNANGHDIFTFSLVGSNLNAQSAIYVKNIRYVDAVPTPVLTAEATDITDSSATLSWNATFPEGYTDTSVTINGEPAEGTSMQLTGLTPKTAYTYTVKATGIYNGETYSVEKAVTFTTLRETGDSSVWYGETDITGFHASYSITYNTDKTLTITAEFETEKETPAADRNFHIYIGGDEWIKVYDNDHDGIHEGTSTKTYEEGTTITWEWYLPYAGGVYQQANTYVVGSENEAPLALRVKAEAQNITFNSAEIAYSVIAPAGTAYKVYYKTADTEAVEATESPITLTGLTESTEYTYEVYAVTIEEDALESRHAIVTFKTTAETARDYVYSDLFKAEFKNAFKVGETEDMRRSFFVSLPWSVTYRADGTAVYSIDLSQVSTIVGLVPQIYWNGFKSLTAKENGIYEYEFGAQELDAEVAISHYFAYSGGVVDVRSPYTKWGTEQEAPELGEATGLSLSASNAYPLLNEKVILSAVPVDAAGYYLPASDISYTSEGGPATIANGIITLTDVKGPRTITADAGGITSSIVVTAIASPEATNLLFGKVGVTDTENIQGGTVENVTDANRESQLEWKCTETQEHYLVYDLGEGEGYYIEAIDLLFEGAYATNFTVTLSSQAPEELGAAAETLAAATEDVVFSPVANNTQHYFMQDPSGSHRYVTLRTTEALNIGWGIKVRDLKVYGTATPPSTTGVEEIAVEGNDSEAPVEFYDLNGRRVNNPANGLYIRRQGNSVTKVIIR